MSVQWGPWIRHKEGLIFRQHGETGRVQDLSVDYINARETRLATAERLLRMVMEGDISKSLQNEARAFLEQQ